MEILENKTAWAAHYRQNWLAQAQENGFPNWKIYQHPRNEAVPGTPGVRLDISRLLFITSSGAYLPAQQRPFDAANLYGDYSMRSFPVGTPFSELAYGHEHYDHAHIDQDPQSALPLSYLAELVTTGVIGDLAPNVVSFMGYQPDSARVVDELIPPIIKEAQAQHVQAALLAPV